jgi:periplasmic divalent cation tolerance protein
VSPLPVESGPTSPMRLVLSAYPSRDAAVKALEAALARRLVACGSVVPAESRYWWNGRVEAASESLVLFKTVPKRLGALFGFLRSTHPYDVPEIVELDLARVDAAYGDYLAEVLDPASLAARDRRPPRRPGAPRGPGAHAPRRTRARPHRRSR